MTGRGRFDVFCHTHWYKWTYTGFRTYSSSPLLAPFLWSLTLRSQMFQYWRSGSFRACVLPASNHLPVLDVALQRRKFYLAWRNASLTCLCFDGPISARLGAARGVKQWLSHEPNRLLGNIDIIGLLFNNKTKPLLNCQVRVTGDQWFRTCFGAWWPITGEVKCQDL